jgi:quinol monooxygenase YgiN
VIIIAGHLLLDPAERAAYLDAVAHVAPEARATSGCLDFVQVADPVEPDRIVIYERWESDQALLAFRDRGGDRLDTPELRGAEVAKYRISAIEPP